MPKLLLCAALSFLASQLSAQADQPKPLNFTYAAIDGTTVDLAAMRGKVVIIFFWATWSKPSRDDVPILVRAYKKYRDQGFAVLGVSLDSDQTTMQTYTDEYNMPWPEYFDGRGDRNQVAQTMNVKEIPSVWLIGKDGCVISVNANGDLDTQIEKSLKAR